MTDYTSIKDKNIALLIWNTEKENDAHIYLGKIIKNGNDFHFVNKSKNWNVALEPTIFERLQEVTEETKNIFLNADLFFSFSISGLPDDSTKGLISTGMTWH